MLTAAFLGLVLIVVLVVAASLYRKWKIEQEIEGLLWKIDKDELQFQQLFGEHTQSRVRLKSPLSTPQVFVRLSVMMSLFLMGRESQRSVDGDGDVCRPEMQNPMEGLSLSVLFLSLRPTTPDTRLFPLFTQSFQSQLLEGRRKCGILSSVKLKGR